MTLRAVISLLLMLTTSACRVVSAGLGKDGGRVINVKEFGAKGNGAADETVAIQTAINAAKPGETIYFPAGVYNVANFVVKNRSSLSFAGEGRKSIIKQISRAERIATIETSRDIAFSNLTFDANGVVSYGGVVFYATEGVRIENNAFIDSVPQRVGNTDRYSFVFGRGSAPSRDIKILNNLIEDLQLEVDHSQRVVIDRNTVKRGVKTGAIGIFTVGDGAIAEDYQITNNTVIDSLGDGFSVVVDPPANGRCVFRRITLAANRVIRTHTAGFGIRIGALNNSIPTKGNIFENIVIENNQLQIASAAPQPNQMIFANASTRAGIIFTGLSVRGNRIENAGPKANDYAIDLRQIQKSFVGDNTVTGVTNGISLSGDLLSNELRNNVVGAHGVAYRLDGSLGGNRAANNRVIGNPRQKWSLSGLTTSDSVEQ